MTITTPEPSPDPDVMPGRAVSWKTLDGAERTGTVLYLTDSYGAECAVISGALPFNATVPITKLYAATIGDQK